MELEGLEPSTYRLPADRSSQLSYSPMELILGGGVYRRKAPVSGRGSSQGDAGAPVNPDWE